MTQAIVVKNLTRSYRGVTAVDNVSLSVNTNGIYGLLGRNGAGKTTLMRLLAGHEFATTGEISVLGENPVENNKVLSNMAFIQESIRYPENYKIEHVLKAAAIAFANWDAEFAEGLVDTFRIPRKRLVRKLSRGQFSAVGVVVGLAARTPITILDEPYIGMDAVARKQFYDILLADYIEHPRTIIISTHLIDEVADLLEHVFVIDQGRITLDANTEDLRGSAVVIEGPAEALDQAVSDFEVLESQTIGTLKRVVVSGVTQSRIAELQSAGFFLKPATLQQLVISKTNLEALEKVEVA
jgi:ABC-2 type transport system ATP-binding protein